MLAPKRPMREAAIRRRFSLTLLNVSALLVVAGGLYDVLTPSVPSHESSTFTAWANGLGLLRSCCSVNCSERLAVPLSAWASACLP